MNYRAVFIDPKNIAERPAQILASEPGSLETWASGMLAKSSTSDAAFVEFYETREVRTKVIDKRGTHVTAAR